MRVIDFFCGAGGFSEGFKQQGFDIILGVDYWKPAIQTFNHNFNLKCEPRDVLEFGGPSTKAIEDLPESEIIIGSPPCVSFSSSNKSGLADKSLGLKLTKTFLRVVAVKKHQPNSILKAWFMENVANSKIHLPKQYSFTNLGLKSWAQNLNIDPNSIAIDLENNQYVVNSADFGVPQSRTRVFAGEILLPNKLLTPERTHKSPNQKEELPIHITIGDIKKKLPSPLSKDSNEPITDPLYPEISIPKNALTDQFYDTGLYAYEWRGSKFLKTNHPYMGTMSFPERDDRPSRTITATKIGNSREAIIYRSSIERYEDGEYRTPTIREAATLMGFPITYQFLGTENSKWRLVGNAVCPPVSRAFAKNVREEFKLSKIKEKQVRKTVELPGDFHNLNTFKVKVFDSPRKRKSGSRFRRHPFKAGNLTVTLSNYDIEKKEKSHGVWHTSIQYGTGAGYPIQKFKDGYYKILEPIIMGFEGGAEFINTINNGFSKRIPNATMLQEIYESQKADSKYLGPIEIVDNLGEIIESIKTKEPNFDKNDTVTFHKDVIPKKQIFALYAINKICSIVNGGK